MLAPESAVMIGEWVLMDNRFNLNVPEKNPVTDGVVQGVEIQSAHPGAQEEFKIAVRDFNLFYGKFHALGNIDMKVRSQRITAIIGPSGCGKSTLLRSMNRMNDLIPNVTITGEIKLENENIYDPDLDVVNIRRRVGMVFQRPNPFPKSIYGNVAYGPRLYGVHRRSDLDGIVEKSLKQAALWDEVKDLLQRSALALSGGQQQRLCLARSLALQPEIILLDEPTSGLDPISTGKIELTLQELKKEYTIILVPHSVQQAARTADYAGFFLQGELVEWAPGKDIFIKPVDKRTEDYIEGRFG